MEGAPRRRVRPGVFTVRVGPGEPLPRLRSTCSRSRATGGTLEGARLPAPGEPASPEGTPAAAPPAPGAATAPKPGCGSGEARRGPGADNERGGDVGGGGDRGAPPTAPSSPPAPCSPRRPAPLPTPVRAPAPRSGRRGRGPRAWPATPPQITKLPPTPPTKLRSHREAPGAPPRAQPEQLRTFAAEKDNRQPLTRRRRRLEAAAAEATSGHCGLSGAQ